MPEPFVSGHVKTTRFLIPERKKRKQIAVSTHDDDGKERESALEKTMERTEYHACRSSSSVRGEG